MIIIVEGLDRCGKDTQIKNIKQYLLEENENKSVHIIHYSALPVKDNIQQRSLIQYFDMFRIMNACIEFTDMHLIFNRSHIGEAVYSPLYRSYSGEYIYNIESEFKHILPKIYLITFIDTSLNCLNRDDGLSLSNSDIDKVKKEIDLFVDATNKSSIGHKLIVDIKDKSIDEVRNIIVDFIS